jgi:hypothetical protein
MSNNLERRKYTLINLIYAIGCISELEQSVLKYTDM